MRKSDPLHFGQFCNKITRCGQGDAHGGEACPQIIVLFADIVYTFPVSLQILVWIIFYTFAYTYLHYICMYLHLMITNLTVPEQRKTFFLTHRKFYFFWQLKSIPNFIVNVFWHCASTFFQFFSRNCQSKYKILNLFVFGYLFSVS